MRTEMTHHNGDVIGAAGLGTIAGLIAHYAALLPSVPPWVAQIFVTLLVSVASMAANHFVKRYLNRRWPDRHRQKEEGD
jgi:membrane protein implicated in regulation of membrane protease activity